MKSRTSLTSFDLIFWLIWFVLFIWLIWFMVSFVQPVVRLNQKWSFISVALLIRKDACFGFTLRHAHH